MIEIIGTNAGQIWNALNASNGQTGKALKKSAKLKSDKDLYAALGWLAREGKVNIEKAGDDIVVTLL